MTLLCTLIRGQMSYTFFQLGGTCPPMSIAWGADVLICQFSLGGTCPGGKCPTLAGIIGILLAYKHLAQQSAFSQSDHCLCYSLTGKYI